MFDLSLVPALRQSAVLEVLGELARTQSIHEDTVGAVLDTLRRRWDTGEVDSDFAIKAAYRITVI